MYDFKESAQFKSKRYLGVEATIRPLDVARRSRIDMAIADHPQRDAYYELLLDREDVKGDGRKDVIKRIRINEKIRSMERSQTFGPTISECVESIDGLTIHGKLATPELLASSGPDDLIEEIMDFINTGMRISVVEEKNSSSLSDSREPEQEKIQSIAA